MCSVAIISKFTSWGGILFWGNYNHFFQNNWLGSISSCFVRNTGAACNLPLKIRAISEVKENDFEVVKHFSFEIKDALNVPFLPFIKMFGEEL